MTSALFGLFLSEVLLFDPINEIEMKISNVAPFKSIPADLCEQSQIPNIVKMSPQR